MKRPNQVKIGPYLYDILWSDSSWAKYCPKGKDWRDSAGLCDSKITKILIHASSLTPIGQKDTLVHEIIHAVYRSFDLETLKLNRKDKNAAEENITIIATPIIHNLMRENPDVMEWLIYG